MKTLSTKLGIGLIFAGAVVLLMGISRGEVAVVLEKAIRICLGCIGIG